MNIETKDFSLNSGERQVGITLSEIRSDHLFRYQLAVNLIQEHFRDKPQLIFDIFCGNGYGTYSLAKVFTESLCFGIDGSKEAIDLANVHYILPNTIYSQKLSPIYIPPGVVDVVICMESLEHVQEDRLMLCCLCESLTKNGLAIISVPNDEVHSLEKNPHKFHFRHYSDSEFRAILPNGFSIIRQFGQDVYSFRPDGTNAFTLLNSSEMSPREAHRGQVSIYAIKRD